jgi:hypothetical protein
VAAAIRRAVSACERPVIPVVAYFPRFQPVRHAEITDPAGPEGALEEKAATG